MNSVAKDAATAEQTRPYSFWEFPERAVGWEKILPYLLLLSVTVALYGVTAYYSFVWDDRGYIIENRWIHGPLRESLLAVWRHSYFGQYAPIHLSLLAVIYSFFGTDPFGYHLAQLLLHGACLCMLYFVVARIEGPTVAFLATLLFAVYPANAQNVAWVSETKSTLAFLFFLFSFWFFIRFLDRESLTDAVLCVLLLVLSVLSKVNTVVAPVICFFYWVQDRPRRTNAGLWLLGVLLFIGTASAALHMLTAHEITVVANELLWDAAQTDLPPSKAFPPTGYFGGFAIHMLNLPRILLFYIRMVFYPYPLSAWHMFTVYSHITWQVAFAWVGALLLLWLLLRSPAPLAFWQIWFYIFLAPVLQIIPNPIWVADRYLYIPAIGVFVLLSKGFVYLWGRVRKPWLRLGWAAVPGCAVLAFAWLAHGYIPLWRNDLTLWRATAKGCPSSAYCHFNFGNSLYINGYDTLAVSELFHAVELRQAPNYLINTGIAAGEGLGDYNWALKIYGLAAQNYAARLSADSWARIALAHYKLGRVPEAAKILADHHRAGQDSVEFLVVEAFVLASQGNPVAARAALKQSVRLEMPGSNPAQVLAGNWPDHEQAGRLLRYLGPL